MQPEMHGRLPKFSAAPLAITLRDDHRGDQKWPTRVGQPVQLITEVGVLNEVPAAQRAFFAVPEPVSEEEFERQVEEANRIGAERARREAELRRRNDQKSQE
jgi:hypothetical protein